MDNIREICENRWEYITANHDIKCLELNISEACNYQCTYCIFRRNSKKVSLMRPEFAAQMAIAYNEYLNGRNGLIYLGAGEPLLNWDAIVRVCEELEQIQSKIELRFMTNASLLTTDKLKYIKDHNIGIGFSIDGLSEKQRLRRIPIDNKVDSFNSVINALEMAKSSNYNIFSLSATYDTENFLEDAKFVINLCCKYGIREFDLDFDINALTNCHMETIANELVACYQLAIEHKLEVFGYWLIPYLNQRKLGVTNYCGNSMGNIICIAADGTIKLCGYDSKTFGQFKAFDEIFTNFEYVHYLKSYTLDRNNCKNCELFNTCYGQCIFLNKENEAWRQNCSFLKYVTKKLNSLFDIVL